jgi:hypothetical protein
MKRWQKFCAGLAAVVGLMPQASAQQFPGIPSPTPAPAVPAVGAAAGAPAAPQANLFSFLCPTQDQKRACRECLCQSQLGLLFNNGLAPVTAFSGGLIPSLCPGTPTAAELADQGAVGAAARIKKEEAEAKARRAAVRYLGTVSCHYFPDAEKALIGSLRGDTNECVRWEAAMALGSGCCCTKKTIQALVICVSGSEEDKKPAEVSPRVKAAAEIALQHCLECYKEIVPAKEKEKEPEGGTKPKGPETAPPPAPGAPPAPAARLDSAVQQTAYYDQVDSKPMPEIVINARRVLAQLHPQPVPATATAHLSALPTGERSVYNLLTGAFKQPPPKPAANGTDADGLVPQTTQVASTAPKPPLIELEPPTDLYHVLMARRQERQAVASKRMPSEPIFSETASSSKLTPLPSPTAVAFGGPTGYENVSQPPAPVATYPGPTGSETLGKTAPRVSIYPGPAGYEQVGFVPPAVDPQLVPPADPKNQYHIIGESPRTSPAEGNDSLTGAEAPQASLAKPAPTPYWSNGTPITPRPQGYAAAANAGSKSPYHSLDYASSAGLSQPQPPSQPYAQFPAPADAAPKAEPPQSPPQPAPSQAYAQFPVPVAAASTAEPSQSPSQPVVQVQAQVQASPEVPAPLLTPPTLAGLLILLRDAPETAQREWAVTRLAAVDWAGHEEVLSTLLEAACKDPEPKVRLQCIRCLIQKKITTVPAIRALQILKKDIDAQVRQEASQALVYMMTN